MPKRLFARTVFSLCLSLTTLVTAVFASQFQNAKSFPVGKYPVSAAAADLNKDGKMDLIVANSDQNFVSVLLGNGNGTFQPAIKSKVNGYPYTVAVGDFNGDGNLDLAVGLNLNMAILLGNGDGTFQPAMVIANYGVDYIATADFNGDGKLDLIYVDGYVELQLGNGDGTFQHRTSFVVNGAYNSLVIGDFNGDGNLDVAVNLLFGNPENIAVLIGNGKGSFNSAATYAAGLYPYSLTVADFNGDGKLDLAVSNEQSSSSTLLGSVSVLLGKGDGTFQTAHTFDAVTDIYARTIATSDFNGDGKADLAVVNEYSNDVTELLGNGDGTFQRGIDWSVGNGALFVLVSDFNGDGMPDLATINYQSDDVTVLLGAKGGTFSAARTVAVGSFPLFGATGDFNEDGKPDLVATTPGGLNVMLGRGNGAFSLPVTYATVGPSNPDVVVADLNRDSHLDLVEVNQNIYGSDTVSVLLGNGDGTFQAAVNYDVGVDSISVSVGDFNGDGITDLAVANHGYSQPGNVSLLLGNGDGTFHPAASIFIPSFYPYWIIAGDFNGDGKQDLADVSGDVMAVLLGNGDGTFQAPIVTTTSDGAVFGAAADLNGDGVLDLVTASGLSNSVSVLLGNGDGTFQPPTTYKPGANPVGVVIADFNGDGAPDIAVANGGTLGGTGSFTILRGKGDGTFTLSPGGSVGCNPISIALTDFNGDGHPDLAIFNVQSNEATILMNTAH